MRSLTVIGFLVVLILCLPALDRGDREISLLDGLIGFSLRMLPPDFSDWRLLLMALWESFQMAFLGTLLGALLALPLSILGGPWSGRALQSVVLVLFAGMRAIPALVWAVLAVVIVGPFPFAGVLALLAYSMGYLGKFLQDDFRSLDLNLWKSLGKWGLPPLLTFRLGVWPQLRKRYLAHCLWMLEYNTRSASIIGYVGAGGLGLRLFIYQEYGQWQKFASALIMIFIVVLVFEVLLRITRPKNESLQTANR
jgi:phosphonate transport system permease protein